MGIATQIFSIDMNALRRSLTEERRDLIDRALAQLLNSFPEGVPSCITDAAAAMMRDEWDSREAGEIYNAMIRLVDHASLNDAYNALANWDIRDAAYEAGLSDSSLQLLDGVVSGRSPFLEISTMQGMGDVMVCFMTAEEACSLAREMQASDYLRHYHDAFIVEIIHKELIPYLLRQLPPGHGFCLRTA